MTSSGAVSIQSARLSQIGVKRQVLKEGSSVLVRVISDRGGGKYEGSVAGVRVQLTSSKPLRPGETFTANIGVKDGTIVVTPREAAGEIAFSFNGVSQNQLFVLLETLGLPVDKLSSSILQSFKQMGLKMDSALANKIRSMALRFAGKEKSAAEIISLLSQKGLEADEDEIKELLALLEGDDGTGDGSGTKQNQKPGNAVKSKEKLINRINSTEGAWYLLPFELVQLESERGLGVDGRQLLGSGCIRLLFDTAKSLKLLKLDCSYNNQKYIFSLAYEGRKITNTCFNVTNEETPEKIRPEEELIRLKKHFMAAGLNGGKLSWAEKEAVEGNASGLETFVSFGGQV